MVINATHVMANVDQGFVEHTQGCEGLYGQIYDPVK